MLCERQQDHGVLAFFSVSQRSRDFYIECTDLPVAEDLIRSAGFDGTCGPRIVSPEDRMALLGSVKVTPSPLWATDPSGDLVFLTDGWPSDGSAEVDVLSVPHWPDEQGGGHRLMTANQARALWPEGSEFSVYDTSGGFDMRKDGRLSRQFIGGLELLSIRASSLSPETTPHPDDLYPYFLAYVEREKYNNINDTTFEFLDSTYLSTIARKLEAQAIVPGDLVEVQGTETLAGLSGIVEDVNESEACILVNRDPDLGQKVHVSTLQLRRIFRPGDLVTVISGVHKNTMGMVLLLDGEVAILVDEKDNVSQIAVRTFSLVFRKSQSFVVHAPLLDIPDNERPRSATHPSVLLMDVDVARLLPIPEGIRVKIRKGVHIGFTGTITSVSGDLYSVWDEVNSEQVYAHRGDLDIDDWYYHIKARKDKLIGKEVLVTGTHTHKGYAGKVIDVHPGTAHPQTGQEQPFADVALDFTRIAYGQNKLTIPLSNLALDVQNRGKSRLVPVESSDGGSYVNPVSYRLKVHPPLHDTGSSTPRASTPGTSTPRPTTPGASMAGNSEMPWVVDDDDVNEPSVFTAATIHTSLWSLPAPNSYQQVYLQARRRWVGEVPDWLLLPATEHYLMYGTIRMRASGSRAYVEVVHPSKANGQRPPHSVVVKSGKSFKSYDITTLSSWKITAGEVGKAVLHHRGQEVTYAVLASFDNGGITSGLQFNVRHHQVAVGQKFNDALCTLERPDGPSFEVRAAEIALYTGYPK
ncbi:hypothetical protein K474DRAFT_1701634 [Panus rudis PR-1116 ss-1]|nr:hypothetical protein K474DRAFT_1701634 [Panus rudis PR-1116 ss-1]